MPDTVGIRNGRDRPDAGPDAHEADDATLVELRSLIVGPDLADVRALKARVTDPAARTRDVGAVLADAIAQRAGDPQLARALAPPVEEAITASVRRDPQPLADALFPAIGPAIRKAIAHTLSSMMDSLNRTVEQSLSWRAVQWRWTALRTGKPFAEIVLLHTLHYRVEQVFLIHRETGLVLQHLSHDPRARQDADQISAMLTAITDFVRESFRVSAHETVETLRVGDLEVLVEQGPQAVLAGVVRGTTPPELRAVFQEALERIHRQLAAELGAFRGDSGPFERARPVLESCLVSRFREPEKRPARWGWRLAGAALLALLAIWIVAGLRERQRWNRYLDRIASEPGLAVLESGRRGGRFFVTGLRDPLAADPASFVTAAGLPADAIEARWEPYQALQPVFILARARDLLRPPDTVSLTFSDGVLTAAGRAPDPWIVESERLAPAIAGVRQFVYTGARADEELKARIEAVSLQFQLGRSVLVPGQDAAIRELNARVRDLDEALRARGGRGGLAVVGHTDRDGPDRLNASLSRARADVVAALLGGPFAALDVRASGVGSADPLAAGGDEDAKRRNRRVSFRVQLPERRP